LLLTRLIITRLHSALLMATLSTWSLLMFSYVILTKPTTTEKQLYISRYYSLSNTLLWLQRTKVPGSES